MSINFKKSAAILLIFTGIGVSAQSRDIKWIETNHDFGAFHEETGIVNTTFKCVNISSEPIYILGARANCGCTTPSYPRDPIAPGDTAFISVGFNPSGRLGKFSKYVLVDTGSPESGSRERTRLTICGTVIGSSNTIAGQYPVEVGPLKLRSEVAAMGEVVKGRTGTASIAGYNRGEDSIVPKVTGLPKYMSATIRPEKVAPGEMVNILFSLDTHQRDQWGILTENCTVTCDNDSAEITAVAIVVEDFSRLSQEELAQSPTIRVPEKITIGEISRNDAAFEIKDKITNTGKTPLLIRRVYTTEPGISVYAKSDKIAPGKSTDIIVKVDPAALRAGDKLINARAIVICNDPTSSQTTLRVAGIIKD